MTPSLTGLSYERLLPYRDVLMRALFTKVQTGVESPQAFAAYARNLTLAPEPGTLPNPDPIIQAFVRDILLTGNGTLFVADVCAPLRRRAPIASAHSRARSPLSSLAPKSPIV